jgi:hypothetical protein
VLEVREHREIVHKARVRHAARLGHAQRRAQHAPRLLEVLAAPQPRNLDVHLAVLAQRATRRRRWRRRAAALSVCEPEPVGGRRARVRLGRLVRLERLDDALEEIARARSCVISDGEKPARGCMRRLASTACASSERGAFGGCKSVSSVCTAAGSSPVRARVSGVRKRGLHGRRTAQQLHLRHADRG